jgi:hypothetical protein
MSRCRKHTPELLEGLLDRLAGKVRCTSCGRFGRYSNGSRSFGRPRRVIWFSPDYSAMLAERYNTVENTNGD